MHMAASQEHTLSIFIYKFFYYIYIKPEHLEALLLLATLKISVKKSHDYSKEMELLEKFQLYYLPSVCRYS